MPILQGSWKEQLRSKFKNMRRPPRGEKRPRERDPEDEDQQPARRTRGGRIALTTDESAVYEENITNLNAELQKHKPKSKRIKSLMGATHNGRRAWIENDQPSVQAVLEKFILLKKPKHVGHSSYIVTCSI